MAGDMTYKAALFFAYGWLRSARIRVAVAGPSTIPLAETRQGARSLRPRARQIRGDETMNLPTPYHQEDAVTIYHADCREILPLLGRFDLLLTDPPYGIGENPWDTPDEMLLTLCGKCHEKRQGLEDEIKAKFSILLASIGPSNLGRLMLEPLNQMLESSDREFTTFANAYALYRQREDWLELADSMPEIRAHFCRILNEKIEWAEKKEGE